MSDEFEKALQNYIIFLAKGVAISMATWSVLEVLGIKKIYKIHLGIFENESI